MDDAEIREVSVDSQILRLSVDAASEGRRLDVALTDAAREAGLVLSGRGSSN